MSDPTGLPDQEPGSPHPREVYELYGHQAEEAKLAESLEGGRRPHAWLICGPKGVGKATLAYRLARRLLGAAAFGDAPLGSDPDDPIVRKIAQGSHPDLRTATRLDPEKNEIKRDVTVLSVRQLTSFFALTADGVGGARVGIVDCADDMSMSAANALLKTLEEPPAGGSLILLSHAPGRLLPTLRSRCRKIALHPLTTDEMARVLPDIDPVCRALARGCPGRAKALAALNIGQIYTAMSAHLSGLPRAPLDEALALGERSQANGDTFLALFDMLADWLARAGRAGLGLPIDEIEAGESAVLGRLAANAGPDKAAECWTKMRELREAVDGLNLDRGLATLEALRIVRAELSPRH
jgi:DNA polymerase-3 subunit delta'